MNLAIFTPFIKEGLDNHNEWEKKFYAEAEKLRNQPKA
jgi:beta-hydroxylase